LANKDICLPMTAQISETIVYQNKVRALMSCPLDALFSLGHMQNPFSHASFGLIRGYIGHWEIHHDRLYLTGIYNETDFSTNNLHKLFEGYDERVFAHWYSGTLRMPEGKLLEYLHLGFGSQYERDVVLKVKRGRITGKTVKDNKPCKMQRFLDI